MIASENNDLDTIINSLLLAHVLQISCERLKIHAVCSRNSIIKARKFVIFRRKSLVQVCTKVLL